MRHQSRGLAPRVMGAVLADLRGRGLAVEENGRLRKDLRAPGRSGWQTEGLPPAILTPSVASRLAEVGASGGAKLWDKSGGRHARRRESKCGLRASAEPLTKVRCHTGPGRVAREAPGSALFRLGSPGAGAPHCPLMRMKGEGTPRRMDH
ncbi:hypothetical protein NDU88_007344 [Pleurodeles waltl]|uniref:Uncharacterized protein n=1 Tax=Pleurodeles waltl TaxID=8319 RepID=A0AAV7P0L2_PLEWA|nr:hypothetical protein NDU88_007344 [Pleurodeles waltl]